MYYYFHLLILGISDQLSSMKNEACFLATPHIPSSQSNLVIYICVCVCMHTRVLIKHYFPWLFLYHASGSICQLPVRYIKKMLTDWKVIKAIFKIIHIF